MKSKTMLDTNVTFKFDAQSMKSLEELQAMMGVKTFGEVVKESLQINLTIHNLAKRNYNKTLVRNTTNGEERVLEIPSLL